MAQALSGARSGYDVVTDVPPSPTLTNPDMILPYNPLPSSPSPLASSPMVQESSLPLSPDSGVSLGSSPPDLDPHPEGGVATTVRMPLRLKPAISSTYTAYEHGAPLSDIGEEETPRSRATRKSRSPSPTVERVSPTPVGSSVHGSRRLSHHSSSSTGSDVGSWEDFDTSKMMNGRLAVDVANLPDEVEIEDLGSKRNSTTMANAEDEMALLNERAERILENARKRLTHMEDNLSKARHSILLSPRSSPNMSDLHQPAGGLYRSISLAGASRRSRPLYPIVKTSPTAHSRGTSDTTNTSGLKRLSMNPEIRSTSALEYGRRTESPLQMHVSPTTRFVGTQSPTSSRSFNSPLRVLKEEEDTPSTSQTSPENFAPHGLGINTLATVSKEDVSAIPSPSPVSVVRSPSAASTRSTREIREQMSDLRTRIADLKNKAQADSMRRRSVQNFRTPSPFTSAPTPEQWYASAPGSPGGGSLLDTNAGLLRWGPLRDQTGDPVTPKAQKLLEPEQPATTQSGKVSEARTDKNTPSLHTRAINVVPEADDANSIIQESHYEDAAQGLDDDEPIAASEEEQIYLNEVLEESLQEVEPDVPDLPGNFLAADGGAERHEDRIDAFDYENMFLHSALGNYTGTGLRSSSPSESDDSSVTTRRAAQSTPTGDEADDEEAEKAEKGERAEEEEEEERQGVRETTPVPQPSNAPSRTYLAPPQPWMKATRSNSMDSVSTVATFATATEGGHDEGEQDEEEDSMPYEILHWGNGTSFPQPPRADAAPGWPTPPMNRPNHEAVSVVDDETPTPTIDGPVPEIHAADGVGPQDVDHTANTEILMESLIKLADPDFKVPSGTTAFADIDKDLVLNLLRAVGSVCDVILKAEKKGEARATKALRRRLEDARSVLEDGADG